MTGVRRFAWLLAISLWVVAGLSVAQAHDADDYYNLGPPFGLETWPGASPNVTVHFTDEVMGSVKRDSIRFGFNKWDNAGGASFTFTFSDNDHADYSGWSRMDCSPQPNNDIHWDGSIPASTGFIGFTAWCIQDGDIVSFLTIFDTDFTWHVGSGDPGSNENDLRSVAAHESGHATGGWGDGSQGGHWNEGSSYCPSGSDRHTMCPSIPTGSTMMRTLENHDAHTFANAYP